MYPGKTEPMIKNTTHSSTGCNGMANNDDYHGLEMYKNHAKDSTTDSPHLGESIFGIKCIQCSGDICCCVAVCLLDVPKKSKTQKIKK